MESLVSHVMAQLRPKGGTVKREPQGLPGPPVAIAPAIIDKCEEASQGVS